ncbi:MAG: MBL fold metallo-hydrolase [Bacteroidetes bacterium]|nr:MAG: MBL fold metallo-hydrolase [Bacteroidota bacterium]
MKVKFCGAAQTVTGSNHLLTTDDGIKILLDCGLYQGRDPDFDDFNQEWSFNPEEIDVLVLSHSHIDHAGRIPKLVRDGFRGNIICTSATRDLCSIMLLDSGFIQEKDNEWVNKKRARKNLPAVPPLYTVHDAQKAMKQFVGISYGRWFNIARNVEVQFNDAGHILGSANVTLKIEQADRTFKHVGFTGDIGRPDRPILRDPQPMPPCDYLLCESTYGGQEHQGMPSDEADLLRIIKETCEKKRGKLIIPAFSIGRTQELVYMIDRLETAGKLPSVPVYVDSPLAVNATDIFIMHPECYDSDILAYMQTDPNPFGFRKLNYVKKVEDSKAINESKEPCIIISASGMMQAGRVKHHLNNNIEDAKNTILIVGFCAQNTLGRRISDGADEVRIFGQKKQVKADVVTMGSFSAHGDQQEMLDFLQCQDKSKLKNIFLVHGELDRQTIFKEAILADGFSKVEIPELDQEFILD